MKNSNDELSNYLLTATVKPGEGNFKPDMSIKYETMSQSICKDLSYTGRVDRQSMIEINQLLKTTFVAYACANGTLKQTVVPKLAPKLTFSIAIIELLYEYMQFLSDTFMFAIDDMMDEVTGKKVSDFNKTTALVEHLVTPFTSIATCCDEESQTCTQIGRFAEILPLSTKISRVLKQIVQASKNFSANKPATETNSAIKSLKVQIEPWIADLNKLLDKNLGLTRGAVKPQFVGGMQEFIRKLQIQQIKSFAHFSLDCIILSRSKLKNYRQHAIRLKTIATRLVKSVAKLNLILLNISATGKVAESGLKNGLTAIKLFSNFSSAYIKSNCGQESLILEHLDDCKRNFLQDAETYEPYYTAATNHVPHENQVSNANTSNLDYLKCKYSSELPFVYTVLQIASNFLNKNFSLGMNENYSQQFNDLIAELTKKINSVPQKGQPIILYAKAKLEIDYEKFTNAISAFKSNPQDPIFQDSVIVTAVTLVLSAISVDGCPDNIAVALFCLELSGRLLNVQLQNGYDGIKSVGDIHDLKPIGTKLLPGFLKVIQEAINALKKDKDFSVSSLVHSTSIWAQLTPLFYAISSSTEGANKSGSTGTNTLRLQTYCNSYIQNGYNFRMAICSMLYQVASSMSKFGAANGFESKPLKDAIWQASRVLCFSPDNASDLKNAISSALGAFQSLYSCPDGLVAQAIGTNAQAAINYANCLDILFVSIELLLPSLMLSSNIRTIQSHYEVLDQCIQGHKPIINSAIRLVLEFQSMLFTLQYLAPDIVNADSIFCVSEFIYYSGKYDLGDKSAENDVIDCSDMCSSLATQFADQCKEMELEVSQKQFKPSKIEDVTIPESPFFVPALFDFATMEVIQTGELTSSPFNQLSVSLLKIIRQYIKRNEESGQDDDEEETIPEIPFETDSEITIRKSHKRAEMDPPLASPKPQALPIIPALAMKSAPESQPLQDGPPFSPEIPSGEPPSLIGSPLHNYVIKNYPPIEAANLPPPIMAENKRQTLPMPPNPPAAIPNSPDPTKPKFENKPTFNFEERLPTSEPLKQTTILVPGKLNEKTNTTTTSSDPSDDSDSSEFTETSEFTACRFETAAMKDVDSLEMKPFVLPKTNDQPVVIPMKDDEKPKSNEGELPLPPPIHELPKSQELHPMPLPPPLPELPKSQEIQGMPLPPPLPEIPREPLKELLKEMPPAPAPVREIPKEMPPVREIPKPEEFSTADEQIITPQTHKKKHPPPPANQPPPPRGPPPRKHSMPISAIMEKNSPPPPVMVSNPHPSPPRFKVSESDSDSGAELKPVNMPQFTPPGKFNPPKAPDSQYEIKNIFEAPKKGVSPPSSAFSFAPPVKMGSSLPIEAPVFNPSKKAPEHDVKSSEKQKPPKHEKPKEETPKPSPPPPVVVSKKPEPKAEEIDVEVTTPIPTVASHLPQMFGAGTPPPLPTGPAMPQMAHFQSSAGIPPPLPTGPPAMSNFQTMPMMFPPPQERTSKFKEFSSSDDDEKQKMMTPPPPLSETNSLIIKPQAPVSAAPPAQQQQDPTFHLASLAPGEKLNSSANMQMPMPKLPDFAIESPEPAPAPSAPVAFGNVLPMPSILSPPPAMKQDQTPIIQKTAPSPKNYVSTPTLPEPRTPPPPLPTTPANDRSTPPPLPSMPLSPGSDPFNLNSIKMGELPPMPLFSVDMQSKPQQQQPVPQFPQMKMIDNDLPQVPDMPALPSYVMTPPPQQETKHSFIEKQPVNPSPVRTIPDIPQLPESPPESPKPIEEPPKPKPAEESPKQIGPPPIKIVMKPPVSNLQVGAPEPKEKPETPKQAAPIVIQMQQGPTPRQTYDFNPVEIPTIEAPPLAQLPHQINNSYQGQAIVADMLTTQADIPISPEGNFILPVDIKGETDQEIIDKYGIKGNDLLPPETLSDHPIPSIADVLRIINRDIGYDEDLDSIIPKFDDRVISTTPYQQRRDSSTPPPPPSNNYSMHSSSQELPLELETRSEEAFDLSSSQHKTPLSNQLPQISSEAEFNSAFAIPPELHTGEVPILSKLADSVKIRTASLPPFKGQPARPQPEPPKTPGVDYSSLEVAPKPQTGPSQQDFAEAQQITQDINNYLPGIEQQPARPEYISYVKFLIDKLDDSTKKLEDKY